MSQPPKIRKDKRILSMHSQTSNQGDNKARVVKQKKYLRQTSYNSTDAKEEYPIDFSPTKNPNCGLKRRFEYQYSLEQEKQQKLNQESEPLPSHADGDLSTDTVNLVFYNNFIEFRDMVKDVTGEQIRFEYMQDLYQLDIDQFPQDCEALKIQDLIIASTQVNSTKMKKNWNEEERSILVWIVGKFCAWKGKDFKNIDDQDWDYLASLMNRRDGFSCKQKWLSMLKQQLFLAPWSTKEDENLIEIYQMFASQKKTNKWSSISNEVNRRMQQNVHRTGKQCRERWNNHLNPGLNREPWTDEEDLGLLHLILETGKKWALISKTLNQKRNENAVKNRFNCLIKKEVINFQSKDNELDLQYQKFTYKYSEDLSQQDLKSICQTILKIEWRIKQRKELQSGVNSSAASSPVYSKILDKKEQLNLNDSYSPKIRNPIVLKKKRSSLDHMQLEDTQKGIFNLQHKLQGLTMNEAIKQSQPSIDNLNQQSYQYSLYPDQLSNASPEDFANCQPCLVNIKKDTIYFMSAEQMADYLNLRRNQQFQSPYQPMTDEQMLNVQPQDKMLFKTLNTIEEYSNQGSRASIGQYINSESSHKRYNEEIFNLDRYQLSQIESKLQKTTSQNDSMLNINYEKSEQKIASNNKIIPVKQVWNIGQINLQPQPQTLSTMNSLMNNINLFWPRPTTTPDQQHFPYQFTQPVPAWYTRGFSQMQNLQNRGDPLIQFHSQFQVQNRPNYNYPAEKPQSSPHIQE